MQRVVKVKEYVSGYCINNLSNILCGESRVIKFPAKYVYIEHVKYGCILYDTGYSDDVYNNGIVSKIYNKLNKTVMSNTLASNTEINIHSVKNIIVSHLHPDHIGGIKYTLLNDDVTLWMTMDVYNTAKKPKLLDIVFRNMLRGVLKRNINKVELKCNNIIYDSESYTDEFNNRTGNLFKCKLYRYFDKCYDLFEDASIIGVVINGHAKGQMGIYIPEYNVMYAADACWGNELMSSIDNMTTQAKIIQNNYREYKESVKRINKFKSENPEIRVEFTHEYSQEA